MYQATINLRNGETFTLDFPTVSALFFVCHRLNENVYVKDKLIFARDGKHPDKPDCYYGGYVLSGIEALFKEKT